MHDALLELARDYGIALEYRDIWGQAHYSSPEALRAVFAAMGIDASSEQAARDRLAEHRHARWQEVLPPAIVVREDASPWMLRLNLPESIGTQPMRWVLQEECGREHAASIDPAALPRCDELEIHAERIIARELVLDLRLPQGYHAITLYAGREVIATALLAVVPARCYVPAAIEGQGRVWGITAQLYSVRSRRNWGIGDYSDLQALIEFWGSHGASFIGLNPQHAPYPHNPDHRSPYSPNSRLFKNWLYIDVEACPEYKSCAAAQNLVRSEAFQRRLQELRAFELVDYADVARAKRQVLELLYGEFRAHVLPRKSARARAFRSFQQASGAALRAFALFDALQEFFARDLANFGGWRRWPESYRDPASQAVQRFAAEHLDRIEFFEYLQWQADTQFGAAGRRCAELGLGVGLYEDLAVSADAGGAETWTNQGSFALTASVGAPPDELNLHGQDWGLPPFIPERLRAGRYAPFLALLRANMAHSGALRIDHVMALMRLYWVTAGTGEREGTYVHYPFTDLLGLLALESQRSRCMVIGEDLGTVPDEVRAGLYGAGVLSYRVLYFERDHSGDFKAPENYPQQALVVASTHDLPTVAGWWRGRDIAVRAALELYPTDALRAAQSAERIVDRRRLLAALDRHGALARDVPTDPDMLSDLNAELIVALHAYLASTPANALAVQLEDVLGAIEQVNVPGTVNSYPNWRRKLTLDVEDFPTDPRVDQMIRALARARPHGRD